MSFLLQNFYLKKIVFKILIARSEGFIETQLKIVENINIIKSHSYHMNKNYNL
jgi:hypothetical protein